MTDYAKLAEITDGARVAWNKKYRQAAEGSIIATMLTLCYRVLAAEPTAVTIQLGASDQGDWMIFEHVTLASGEQVETLGAGTEHEVDDSDLWELTSDLPNDGGWQTGTWVHDEFVAFGRRSGDATIDIHKAIAYFEDK